MLICSASIVAAGLAGCGAAASRGETWFPLPLPRAVAASSAIHEAIDRYGRTGEFRLEFQDQPQPGKCVAEYHPLENTLWGLPKPETPDCPGANAAARCITEWFTRWRADLSQVHEAWEDAYCYCVCCPEEGGFDTTEDCTDAMIEVFNPEFQRLIDRYAEFDPAGCCPVQRHGTEGALDDGDDPGAE